jgi:sulfatase modifying factor 1
VTPEYKLYDMSGNVHEWVDHINLPKETGTFKGGFFVDAKINGEGCLYKTIAHSPKYHDYSIGFRCCADA